MTEMLRHDAKSLALYRAIQQKLQADGPSEHLQRAKAWAIRFSTERPEDVWLVEWVSRLDAVLTHPEELPGLYELMLSREQHAIDMRSSSPFPAVLTQKERTQTLLAFEKDWETGCWS